MQHNKFQASLSQVVLKKIFEYFSMYFYGLNQGPPCLGPSWTVCKCLLLHLSINRNVNISNELNFTDVWGSFTLSPNVVYTSINL